MSGKRSVDDESVVRELRAYQAALEAGEDPDRDGILARFPDLEGALAGCLDGIELMFNVAPQLHDGAERDLELSPATALGDFRILREVGRGGMGRGLRGRADVARPPRRAQGAALRRRPRLPLPAAIQERGAGRRPPPPHQHRPRPRRRLRAGGSTPCRPCRPSLEGPTLAGLVDELKALQGDGRERDSSPALAAITRERTTENPHYCRAVARLGIQAAEALECAHESGIVHRDIKPPNLIVDESGHLWITDFGLASTRNDTGLTVTGDIVGTVRYMSPEQALGKRVPLDHRTDIYSLGVTLYELLTLEQAFPGDDARLLMQRIAVEEPRRPRTLNPATPAELETILLKAIAKDPEDRYATAQELADDLRRFTEDRPIHARRPSPWKRAAQWTRRHPAAVRAGAIILLLSVVGMTIGTVLLAQAHEREKTAHERSELEFDIARGVVDRMLTRVSEDLAGQPRMEKLRRDLLEEALAFHLGFLERSGDDPDVRIDAGNAHARVGEINEMLGRHAKAKRAYERVIAVFEALLQDSPRNTAYRRTLGAAWGGVGNALRETGRYEEAERAYERALSTLQEAPTEADPEYLHTVAAIHFDLALALHVSQRKDARGALMRAEKIWERLAATRPDRRYEHGLANALQRRALLLELPAEFEEAETLTRRALDIMRRLAAEDRTVRARAGEAAAWGGLGILYDRVRRHAEAETAYRKAIELLEALAREFPSVPRIADSIGNMQGNLVGVYRETGDLEKRKQALLAVQAVYRKLAQEHKDVPEYRHKVARSHYRLAKVFEAARDTKSAREHCVHAIAIFDTVENDRVDWIYRWEPADARVLLGKYLTRAPDGVPGDPDDLQRAEALLLESIAMIEKLRRGRENADSAGDLRTVPATAHELLGGIYQERGQHRKAEAAWKSAIKLRQEQVEEAPSNAEHLHGLAFAWHGLHAALVVAGRPREARAALENAEQVFDQLIAQHPRPPYRLARARVWLQLAQAMELPKRFAEAEAMMRRYRETVLELKSVDPSPALRMDEGNGWWVTAKVYATAEKQAEAAAAYEKAAEVFDALARQFPADAEYARRLGSVLGNLALVYRSQERFGEEKRVVLRAHEIRRELAGKHEDVPEFQRGLARSHGGLAKIFSREGDIERARKEAARAIDLFEEIETKISSWDYWFDRAGSYSRLATLLAFPPSGSPPAGPAVLARAETLYLRKIAIHDRLQSEYPHRGSSGSLADAFNAVGNVRWRAGKYDDAAEAYREAIRWVNRFIETRPNLARLRPVRAGMIRTLGGLHASRNQLKEAEAVFREGAQVDPLLRPDLALVPVLRPDVTIEEVRKAATSIKATPGVRDSPTWWSVLGRAYYRRGEFPKAGIALGKAMRLAQGGSAHDWLVMAMVHAKLGNSASARRWFDKAIAWIAEFNPADAALERYRAEAGALLARTD